MLQVTHGNVRFCILSDTDTVLAVFSNTAYLLHAWQAGQLARAGVDAGYEAKQPDSVSDFASSHPSVVIGAGNMAPLLMYLLMDCCAAVQRRAEAGVTIGWPSRVECAAEPADCFTVQNVRCEDVPQEADMRLLLLTYLLCSQLFVARYPPTSGRQCPAGPGA